MDDPKCTDVRACIRAEEQTRFEALDELRREHPDRIGQDRFQRWILAGTTPDEARRELAALVQ